ncbi:TerD family protein [Gordonia sp. zg691]|uniref:TerD family protein n=1 Tax=Gordonia jinghuaiqii TaxID=2758710 RepID=UPI00166249DA|nr:TerD family protein [Gordonia jinghuaiqii]MBD0860471.1 TerD family protein [Gordonia jinghuaiqii]
MEPHELAKGGNVSVDDVAGESQPRLIFVIETESVLGKEIGLDAGILILGDDGKVRSNDDLIFYNQPSGAGGAVRLVSAEPRVRELNAVVDDEDSFSHRDAVEVDLAGIPGAVSRVVVTASTDPRTDATFGDARLVSMYVAHADQPDEPFVVHALEGLDGERALIFGEIYRRGDSWKIRAVGQGYEGGLEALVSDHGVEVDASSDDDETDATGEVGPEVVDGPSPGQDGVPTTEHSTGVGDPESSGSVVGERDEAVGDGVSSGPNSSDPDAKVSIVRKRRPAPLPKDWAQRTSAYLPRTPASEWKRARLFPSVGIKSNAEQEMRTTSILLATMETVPEFGRAILGQVGAPRGRIEAFTEVRFTLSGEDVRPDGLIRVSRGGKTWQALVEMKTGRGELNAEQIATYLKLARTKSLDAVITVSRDLMASSDQHPCKVDARSLKNISLKHISWEEVIAEATIVHEHVGVDDRVRARVLEEMLWYAADSQSGMWAFDDMGKQWVRIREAVKNRTVGATDESTSDVCDRFDRLARHVALQLSALTGHKVTAQAPASRVDTVSRARQLADSGELFALLRVPGAAGPVAINADLSRGRIGCSLKTTAPRAGRTQTKVSWLMRQLVHAPDDLRITAHHAGSRVESTSALLKDIREDPSAVLPPDGRDIREFTVTMETSMGSKRSGSEGGFVTAMVLLSTTFYAEVVERVRSGRGA